MDELLYHWELLDVNAELTFPPSPIDNKQLKSDIF